MAGLVFFPDDSWLDKEVSFSWPQPAKWITITKVMEKFSRLNLHQVNSPGVDGSQLSFAVALFLCRNISQPEQEAFVKVYKQVPHVGTEFASHAAQKAQAGEQTHADINAYKLFMENRAMHLPICLGENKLPGLRLDNELFWSLDDARHEVIRKALLHAYEELYSLGVDPGFHDLENLVWDEKANTVYIVNFGDARPIALKSTDESVVCASWGLPQPRKEVKEEYKEEKIKLESEEI